MQRLRITWVNNSGYTTEQKGILSRLKYEYADHKGYVQLQKACCIFYWYQDSLICRDFYEIRLLIQYLLLSACAMILQPKQQFEKARVCERQPCGVLWEDTRVVDQILET